MTLPSGADKRQIIGIVPASGRATRFPGAPCSKEILPLPAPPARRGDPAKVTAACEYLLQSMAAAGVGPIYLVIRNDKWDIPSHLSTRAPVLGTALAYLVNTGTAGAPESIDQVHPFIGNHLTALGFPDIVYRDDHSFSKILQHQEYSGAAVVLGLFPASQPDQCDMVDFDHTGRVTAIAIKPKATPLRHTWGIAVWTSQFSDFLHQFLLDRSPSGPANAAELQIGAVIHAAIQSGYRVDAIAVSDEPYIDIGRPENYLKAVQQLGE